MDLWFYPAAVLAYVLAGVYIGRGSMAPLLAVLAAGAVVISYLKPRLALAIGLGAIALPYTWGPAIPKLGFGMGILVGLLFVIAYVPTLTEFRPTALDYAVLVFALTPAVIAAFQGQSFHITNWIAPTVALPYFGFRLLLNAPDVRRAFPPVIIGIGLAVALIGIWEGVSGHNPIVSPGSLTYSSNGHFVTTWNVPDYRAGHLRALSTFGHPIAFGMFLLIPLAFALARGGRWNLVAAGIILIAEALTYSRGPWVGALVVAALLVGRGRGRILAAAAALILAALFVGPIHEILLQSTSASTEPGNSSYYRLGLLGQAIDHISMLGHPFSDFESAIPNYADVTSLLAGTIIQTGIIGLAELVVIVGLAFGAFLQARRSDDRDFQAGAAALLAQLVGLLAVTLITNYQFFFWALVAYVATSWQDVGRHSRSRDALWDADAAQPLEV